MRCARMSGTLGCVFERKTPHPRGTAVDNEVKYDYDQVLHALSKIYVSLYLFDLKTDTLAAIKSNQYIDKWAAEKEGAQAKTNNVMAKISFPEYVSDMLAFVDFSTLDERIGDEGSTSIVFRGRVNGWCRARFIVLDRDDDGKLSRVIYAVENINKEKEREDHLLYVSQTDLMTGLLNRGSGEAKTTALIEKNENGMFGLFDIDNFKQVNDVYGHQIGDQVLIAVANCMKRVFRDGDVFMRLGGDEFAFFLPGVMSEEVASRISARLFGEISLIHIDPMSEGVTVSLGVSSCREGDTFDSMYSRADRGVYLSKHNKGCSMTIG